MNDFGSFCAGFFHSVLHPDTAFRTVAMMGYEGVGLYVAVLLISSVATIVLYYGNRILFLSRRFSKPLISKIHSISSDMVCKLGYIGLAVLAVTPIVFGFREGALLAGQTLGLKYTLHTVLGFSAIRLYAVFVFGPDIYQFIIKFFINFFQFQ